MAKDEILKMLSDYIGDDTGDSAIALMEKVSDALDDSVVEKLNNEITDLKQQVVDTENTWREKYMKRFTDNTPTTTGDEEKEVVDEGANSEDEYIAPPSFEEIAKEF